MHKQKNNKKIKYFLAGGIALLIIFSYSYKTFAKAPINSRLAGKILLQVENKGEAWYVNTDNQKRYYLGRPADAFYMMRELGLGISETDYWKFGDNENNGNKAPARLAGKILLRVEEHGEAYYVSPADLKMYYLGRPADAFLLMRKQGLGIKNKDLEKIEVGKSVEQVVADRANQPKFFNTTEQNGYEREEREKAQRENDQATCTYANGCEWYKGVMIRWVVDADTFPPEWVADKERINPKAESVTDKDKIDRSIRVLKKALDKYPEYFFTEKKYLRTIYLVTGLQTFHRGCAGTYSIPSKKLYLSWGDNEEMQEQTFHHEYSHILFWRNYDNFFPEKEWDKINPEGFKYDDNGGGGALDPN